MSFPGSFASLAKFYYDVEWNIMLLFCISHPTIISAASFRSHLTVIFMGIMQGREMTFANLLPQAKEDGVTGFQLILV